MNTSTDDLIQRVLEGEASPQERSRLDSRLASEPATKRRYDELANAFRALGSARLEAAPAGMRDAVLGAIRAAAPVVRPAPSRAGRPAFSWLRIALPLAAGALAAAVLWGNWHVLPWRSGDERVTGTMAGPGSTDALRLGPDAHAVLVRWGPSEHGFALRVRAGDLPARVEIESLTPGTRLALGSRDLAGASGRIEANIKAGFTLVVEGSAPETSARIRVRVTLPDGVSSAGELELQGLLPSR